MSKIKVCVLFGGQSGEYEVSLNSAYSVLSAIDKEKYIVYKIGITRNGQWYLFDGENELVLNDSWLENGKNVPICVDFSKKAFICDGLELYPNVIFPLLHGDFGEDGRAQSLFEMMGVPFVGCGSRASAICMDKALCKTIAIKEFVPVAPFITVNRGEFQNDEYDLSLDWSAFVKPNDKGSSIGISRAKTNQELRVALANALAHSSVAIVEQEIKGAECEVAILQVGNEIIVSEVGQISYKGDFYDYQTKYHSRSVKYKIPAKIGTECSDLCKKYAKKMFLALGCRGLCRVDFFVTKSGEIFFNEVNTIPGFTKGSMYPMLLEKQGYDLPRLIDALIDEAIRNF